MSEADFRDKRQLWAYMQHQEDVQYSRMAKTYYIIPAEGRQHKEESNQKRE